MTVTSDVARKEATFDRWGRYRLPSPLDKSKRPKAHSWTRVTTIVEAPSDPYALFEWKQRKLALGFAEAPDLLPRPTWDVAEHKDEINKLVLKAMEKGGANDAARAGSDFHAGAAFLDESGILPKETSPLYHPLLENYQKALEILDLEPVPEYIERSVVIPGVDTQAAQVAGAAGTVDRIYRHKPSGLYVMGDLKSRHSNSDLNYNTSKWGHQLFAYSQATHSYDWETETFTPMPKLAPNGVIISIDLRIGVPEAEAIRFFKFRLEDYRTDWEMALALRAYRSMSKKRQLQEMLPNI